MVFAAQVAFVMIYLPIYMIMKRIVKAYGIVNKRLVKFTAPKNFRVIIIRFFMEGSVEIAISVGIALQFTYVNFSGFWTSVAQSLCICTFFMLLYVPVYLWQAAYEWWDNYDDYEVRDKFQDLFADYKRYSLYSLRYPVVFIIRRYIIVLTCIAVGFFEFSLFYYVQINMQIWSTGFSLCYIAWHQPFKSKKANLQETMNDVFVLLCTYHLFLFTDFVQEESDRYAMGNSLIMIIVINVLFNFAIMFFVEI